MALHELKILPQYFEPVVDGNKTFEIRKNDRGYAIGDLLLLKEYKDNNFTGNAILQEVTYMTTFNQEPGYVVMGIKDPDFDTLESHFSYNRAALLYNGYECLWVLEEASEEDIEESLNSFDASDCC